MSRFRPFVARVRRGFRSVVTDTPPETSSQHDPPDGENVAPEDTQPVPRTARARASVSLYVATFGTPSDTPDATSENDPADTAETVRD